MIDNDPFSFYADIEKDYYYFSNFSLITLCWNIFFIIWDLYFQSKYLFLLI